MRDDDELLMMTARGKIQRIAASDISVIGRNTQGVRIMASTKATRWSPSFACRARKKAGEVAPTSLEPPQSGAGT